MTTRVVSSVDRQVTEGIVDSVELVKALTIKMFIAEGPAGKTLECNMVIEKPKRNAPWSLGPISLLRIASLQRETGVCFLCSTVGSFESRGALSRTCSFRKARLPSPLFVVGPSTLLYYSRINARTTSAFRHVSMGLL